MQYPIFIHKEDDTDYGVTVPDLPGCFSAGHTLEEAISNAEEAIECHLQGLLLDKESVPLKQTLEQHLDDPDLKEGVLAFVDVDLSTLVGEVTDIHLSFPESFLKQIDDYAKIQGSDRSRFLLDAAMNFMAEHPITKVARV